MNNNIFLAQMAMTGTTSSSSLGKSFGQSSTEKVSGLSSFAEQLSRFLPDSNSLKLKGMINRDTSADTVLSSRLSNSELSEDSLLSDLKGATGFDFLSKLKQYLMASGEDLGKISVGENGLEKLKHVLMKAGFKGAEIEELVNSLKENGDGETVLLSDLVNGLFSLDSDAVISVDGSGDSDFLEIMANISEDAESTFSEDLVNAESGTQETPFFDTSFVPFLSSIFKSLGIPDETAASILDSAEIKNQGIDMDILIKQLQAFQNKAFLEGTHFQVSGDDDSIKNMLTQMGLLADITVSDSSADNDTSNLVSDPSAMTLGDFVSALESLRKKDVSDESSLNIESDNSYLLSQESVSGDDESLKSSYLLSRLREFFAARGSDFSGVSLDEEGFPVLPDDDPMKLIIEMIKALASSNVNDASEDVTPVSEEEILSDDDPMKRIIEMIKALASSNVNDDSDDVASGSDEEVLSDDDPLKHVIDMINQLTQGELNSQDENDEISDPLEEIADDFTFISGEVPSEVNDSNTISDSNVFNLLMEELIESGQSSEIFSILNSSDNLSDNLSSQSDDVVDAESAVKNFDSYLRSNEKRDDLFNTLAAMLKVKGDANSFSDDLSFDSLKSDTGGLSVISDSEKIDGEKTNDLKSFLNSLMERLGADSDDSGDLVGNVTIAGNNGNNVKNSFAGLPVFFQKALLNVANYQDNQGTATTAGATPLSSSIFDSQDITNFLDAMDVGMDKNATSPGQNNSESRLNRALNDSSLLFSRIEKGENSSSMDSGHSGGAFSGGEQSREAQLGVAREKSGTSVLPSYVTNQVGKSILRAFNRGESEIRLQLKPAELGRIFMTIDTHGDTLKVSIVTENRAAKELLAGSANDLKATLAGTGINLERFDVEMGSDFSQSMADSREQYNDSNSSGSGRGRGKGGNNGDISSVDEIDIADLHNYGNGALHFVA
ncbi:exported hypothetical protein [Desulfamplus magnetovallimortis]|uniref:Flagellar hook-length control protein-like C-terminal domain-containing protein n=1 Tax=Desulfamplus magnetovallimortis TaxID=1246637 RepID=A0A1W1H9U3_9BACT|nr:flagellar hook-length control protein FliK [Desulfamplus magnetovallimortis]SLM29254.1 exported hypothetical protein [Desulfamplus magnetovallimortis]